MQCALNSSCGGCRVKTCCYYRSLHCSGPHSLHLLENIFHRLSVCAHPPPCPVCANKGFHSHKSPAVRSSLTILRQATSSQSNAIRPPAPPKLLCQRSHTASHVLLRCGIMFLFVSSHRALITSHFRYFAACVTP